VLRAAWTSFTAAAEAPAVRRKTLSAILNGHAGTIPEMAVRLSSPVAAWKNEANAIAMVREQVRRRLLRVFVRRRRRW